MRTLILFSGAILGVTGCSSNAGSAPAQLVPSSQSAYRLTATVQDLMDGIIDPSADVLWNSVAYVATRQAIEDRHPRTDEEWKAVRYSAITLIEAANLLSMPGRKVAAAHTPAAADASPAPGELTRAEIQQRIDSTHDAFMQYARNLQNAATEALTAIDSRNVQGLMDVGTVIDDACEACHVTYWYPNQGRP
jgi:hypothetical protein